MTTAPAGRVAKATITDPALRTLIDEAGATASPRPTARCSTASATNPDDREFPGNDCIGVEASTGKPSDDDT